MPTRTPLNTYRLQLHPGRPFAVVTGQHDYLVELIVTDLYLSPIPCIGTTQKHSCARERS